MMLVSVHHMIDISNFGEMMNASLAIWRDNPLKPKIRRQLIFVEEGYIVNQ